MNGVVVVVAVVVVVVVVVVVARRQPVTAVLRQQGRQVRAVVEVRPSVCHQQCVVVVAVLFVAATKCPVSLFANVTHNVWIVCEPCGSATTNATS